MDVVISALEEQGAILHNQHLVLASGRHASDYINLDFMYPNMYFMKALGIMMATAIHDRVLRHSIDALVAPATGGVALLQWVGARIQTRDHETPRLFWADKQPDGSFAFERADWRKRLNGLRVIGIEDIVTSGGSIKATMEAAVAVGASAELVVAVCNRQGATYEDVGAKRFAALTEVDYPSYPEGTCPLCRDGVPIAEDVGRGAKFKEAHPDYAGGYVELLS